MFELVILAEKWLVIGQLRRAVIGKVGKEVIGRLKKAVTGLLRKGVIGLPPKRVLVPATQLSVILVLDLWEEEAEAEGVAAAPGRSFEADM